jgi:hypothetical protein
MPALGLVITRLSPDTNPILFKRSERQARKRICEADHLCRLDAEQSANLRLLERVLVDGIPASREILESGIENALSLAAEDRGGLARRG